MDWQDFTASAAVQADLAAIKQLGETRRYSDILDKHHHQYVDLVMEGGGVLGLALVGYTFALEHAGLRFRSTAGTSAGAINALFLQAMGSPHQERSKDLVKIVADMPMASFQDGGRDGRFFVDAWLSGSPLRYLSFVSIIDDLFRLGLNPGKTFHDWVTGQLKARGLATWQALRAQMDVLPEGLRYEDGYNPDKAGKVSAASWKPALKIVTAELTTTTKMVLPERDGHLLYKDLNAANPADFVRASMSVPFFFEPWRKGAIPKSPELLAEWEKRGHRGRIPVAAVFVDGGMISNFPINLFHVTHKTPRMPTFGVKLGVDKDTLRNVDGLKSFCGAMIDTMRHDADEEFIHKNPDYRHLVKEIDTGKHHWLNFSLSNAHKKDLFARGVSAARAFLERFDWQDYKARRQALNAVPSDAKGLAAPAATSVGTKAKGTKNAGKKAGKKAKAGKAKK